MKRLLALITAILMLMLLAACADDVPASDDQEEDGYHSSAEDMEIGSPLGSFTSVDLNGNDVTDAIFADKDVTVVNVWATFCGPCIGEMPELQSMADELPDNAQVIGVVIDATPSGEGGGSAAELWGASNDNIELAKEICEKTGAKYTSILASESVVKTFGNVEAVPTTFIVDKAGNLVCKPIIGANVSAYKQVVEYYLEDL